MQIGTRWSVGDPHPALPDAVADAIAQVERDIAGFDTSSWRWTLTFLEGLPVVTLDDGTRILWDGVSATIVEESA